MTNSRFRNSIRLDFGNADIRTVQELRTLMRDKGYRRAKIKGRIYDLDPTQKQLNGAWEYLTDRYEQTQIVKDFVINRYAKHKVFRANRDLIINGKKYRKGWFIPQSTVRQDLY